MFNLEKLKLLVPTVREVVSFLKHSRREDTLIVSGGFLVFTAYSLPGWLPAELKERIQDWILIGQLVCGFVGVVVFAYGVYRIWRLVTPPALDPVEERPAAIKGPMAFTPVDGPLFRKLGREKELCELLSWIQNDQISLIVLMGASGAGKTSLLRAGLASILSDKNIDYHYWEAMPSDPQDRLLRAIRESWNSGVQKQDEKEVAQGAEPTSPQSLDELVNPSGQLCPRNQVIVLDQFEQMRGRSYSDCPVFSLLRKVARDARPPRRVTWIIAFRREFCDYWFDFMIPEHNCGCFPPEMSLGLFSQAQANEVAFRLVKEAGLSVEQKVVENLIDASEVNGEVLPVDIGIGLLVLAGLHNRQASQTVTFPEYHFAGGAEGLLTDYIRSRLEMFPEDDQDKLLKALLALRDPQSKQRIAKGRTVEELAQEAGAEPIRLKPQLDRLSQRDVRLLEVVESEGGAETRYRIPHERFVPALHRLTGKLLAEGDQARLKVEAGFAAWKNANQSAQYLLRGKDLQLVERYASQIICGNDAQQKQEFLTRSRRLRNWSRLGVAALLLGVITLFGLMTWEVRRTLDDREANLKRERDREVTAKMQCSNRLSQITLAFHQYNSENNNLPPAVVYDKNGKPLHSWRVLLLRYMQEYDVLYKKFDLDEPWDSPKNASLIQEMPEVYKHPWAKDKDPTLTYFQVFDGPSPTSKTRAIFASRNGKNVPFGFPGSFRFQSPNSLAFKRVLDGTWHTILLAEAAKGVPWTKPEDLPFEPDTELLPALGGHFAGGFHVIMAGGGVHFIDPNRVSEKNLREAITAQGAELLPPDWHREKQLR